MFGNRLRYFVLLLGLMVYYVASGEWLSWILLVCAAGLPLLSLVISIPAVRQFRVSPGGADVLEIGQHADLWLLGSCDVPMPPFRGSIRLENCLTGESELYRPEKGLAAVHCGAWRAKVEKVRICDYMGIFSFRARKTEDSVLLIRPKPLETADLPARADDMAICWKPKPGGGFSENHELRPFRPGDSMNQVHWKLTAKTGSLTIREPMEAIRGKTVLTMTHGGSPEEIDRKLGRALWIGRTLLKEKVDFEIRALTGAGILTLNVDSEPALTKAMDTLLCTPLASSGDIREQSIDAAWQYHIGGQADET